MKNYNLKQEEKQYKKMLQEFKYKNPNASEEYFIKYRKRIVKKVLAEYEQTANFTKGLELDGKELINGVLTTTKMGTAAACIMFDDELKYLKYRLKELKNPKQPEPQQTIKPKTKADFKEQKPFQIGLMFATGRAQELYKKYKEDKGHFKKICLELGFKENDRPYFSETLNNNKGIKNLYNNTKVITQIHKNCIEKEIDMCDEFLNKYNQIEPE